MRKSVGLIVMLGLMAAGDAQAQFSGGHRHGGQGQGQAQGAPSSSAPAAANRHAPTPKPVSATDIIGVVAAIDPAANRITIAYEPVEVRNWPAGTMPFVVSKPDLLAGATVGEKVRFKLDSMQIIDLQPF